MIRMISVALLLITTTSAVAHQNGVLHSHPHLAVNNEFLAVMILLVGTIGVGIAGQRVLSKRKSVRRRPEQ